MDDQLRQNSTDDGSNCFYNLPVEIVTRILCSLPSLSDGIAVAQSSRQLRDNWTTNLTYIYEHIAPRSIPCEYHARRHLANQVGQPIRTSSILSVHDIQRLINNSRKVDAAVQQFENQIVSRVQCISIHFGFVAHETNWL